MNFKKFYLIFSIIVLVFLFAAGILILNYTSVAAEETGSVNSDLLGIMDDFKMSRNPFNILVLGGDRVAKNTDTMMLVNYNPADSKTTIMSIPRDTRVKVNGKYHKINYAYPHAGAEFAAETVSELLNVNIKYYVFIDTAAFRQIIDILGGVDVTIPVNMDYDDPTQNLHIHLKKGRQHLDGKKAEQYMRFRKPNSGHLKDVKGYYDGSDIMRIQAQQNFVKELISQKANILYLPKVNSIISVIYNNLETNIPLSEMTRLAKSIKSFTTDDINLITLPGSTQDGDPWYYLIDEDKTSDIVAQYFQGSGKYTEYPANTKNSSSNNTNKSSSSSKKSPSTAETTTTKESTQKTSTNNKDMTKDNPSNSETSIEGTTVPLP